MFNKTFLKFLLAFTVIIGISLLIMGFLSNL
jgi:hypothetical protein